MKINLLITFISMSFVVCSQSELITDTLYSNSLGEKRAVTVYLPNGFSRDSVYRVLYTTDGQLFNSCYQRILDSLIAKKAIDPILVIASHSNETWVPNAGGELRNFDYVESRVGGTPELDSRYDKHLKFFSEELIVFAESHYPISHLKQDRMFFGVSNGADFGVSLAQKKSDQFSKFILFSVFQGSLQPFLWTKTDRLQFIIGYGKQEDRHVKEEAIRMKKYFKKTEIDHSVLTWKGGHERKMWELTFVNALMLINWE